MAESPKTELPRQARAIAAWESAVARTLNPHLNEKQAAAVWSAVVKNREAKNVDAFAKALRDHLDGAPTPIRSSAEMLIDNLRTVLAIKD